MADPVPRPSSPPGRSPLSSTPTRTTPSPKRRILHSSSNPQLALSRRPSAQERIDGILEAARDRAESHGSDSGLHSPRLQPLLRNESAPAAGLHEESSEEDHGVVLRPPSTQRLNYHSTTATGPRVRKAHNRKSTTQPGQHPSSGNIADANQTTADATADSGQTVEPWWKSTIKNLQSIELENKGSVARDHLALERTFLAWLRTSLAFASIGIAITQLFRLNTSLSDGTGVSDTLRRLGKPLGAVFLGISIAILFLGYNRYFQGQKWIIQGKFPASRGTIILVSFISFAVILTALVVVITVQTPNS